MEITVTVKGFKAQALAYMCERLHWDPADLIRTLISYEFDAWLQSGRVEESFFMDCALDPVEAQVLE